jgi:hypothetical protein
LLNDEIRKKTFQRIHKFILSAPNQNQEHSQYLKSGFEDSEILRQMGTYVSTYEDNEFDVWSFVMELFTCYVSVDNFTVFENPRSLFDKSLPIANHPGDEV